MSQAQPAPTVTAPPAGAAAAPPASAVTAPLVPAAYPASTPATARMDTPQRLRLLGLGVTLVGVVTGLVGALVLSALAYLLYRAEADTAQLVRVQQIQTNLLVADATATNAFLVGGLEPAEQRARYDQALRTATTLIAEAARAQPADADLLATLNQQVVDYAGAVEQARANNRQELPIGAQYLRSASASLRSQSLPVLNALVDANAGRARDRMQPWVGLVFVFVAAAGLVVLVLAQVWLARRFHRTINRGMLVASVVLLAALVAGVAGLVQLGSALGAVRDGSFADVNAAASARISASDAKANESLTLIARGSGGAFEQAWVTSSQQVVRDLTALSRPAPLDEWSRYRDVHTDIRALDDGGQWDAAVAKATGTGADSANTAFDAFDTRLAQTLEDATADADAALAGQQPGLILGAVLALLAGLAVAVLGRWGVGARLREYR